MKGGRAVSHNHTPACIFIQKEALFSKLFGAFSKTAAVLKKSAAVFGKTAAVFRKTAAVLSVYLCRNSFLNMANFINVSPQLAVAVWQAAQ